MIKQLCTVRNCGHEEEWHNYEVQEGSKFGVGCSWCYSKRVPLGREWVHEFARPMTADEQEVSDEIGEIFG